MTEQGGSIDNEWDTTAYDDRHAFVFEHGRGVVDLLDVRPGERVLDLGCGTEHLTHEIADAGAEVVGLDSSKEMIETARETYPEVRFVRADAREFAFEEPFDAVFSNAALHWIPEQDAVLAAITDALKSGGRFVAELGGTGNLDAIISAVRTAPAQRGYDIENPWYFPSVGEYATKLESHGFEVRYATLFDRPTELEEGTDGLASWLDMFGHSLFESIPGADREGIVADAERELRDEQFEDGQRIADYRRLQIVASGPTE
ncbi:class I SAM-dependent methyltransferase [Haloplanus natans]|uniref:class I SAM-dependent methyltransferase n=1 Tax=Haloplanus natans TaxID=376171 RepID=UPI000677A9BC|nr:methyltransferase domain-containing protein [Haloplanus natans]